MSNSAGTIFVVDDLERNLQIVGELLTRHHFDVVLAQDGESMLKQAESRTPDLILLDLYMPGMSGLDVIRRLKAKPAWMAVPVIFLTAANEKSTIATVLQSGAVDFLSKPFDHGELLARVKVHIDLKRARDDLQLLIEERNRLMAVLAHDIRNPLSAIQMSAHLLENKVQNEHGTELFRTIRNSADVINQLIETHLTESAEARRLGHIELRPVNLDEPIGEAFQTHLMRAERKQILLDLDSTVDDACCVHADPLALRQVLENLVSNAIKFSPPGSTVVVRISDADESIVEIAVDDDGPGLNEEDHRKLWMPYARLSANPTAGEPSTGLGLSIVKDLVDRMDGEIECHSTPGKGASFRIRLKRTGVEVPVTTE